MLISHDDEGCGLAVVLLHAGVCDRRMWDVPASVLARTHRVIRPDLRGFGDTPLPGGQFSFAEDVVALLDHLGIERCTLVGSSFGGRVALEIAVSHPERLVSLVLLNPAFRGLPDTPASDEFDDTEDALLEAGDLDGAAELNVSTWLGPEASEETRERVRVMQRHAFEIQLTAESQAPEPEPERVDVDPTGVAVPTLVIVGEQDMDVFRNIADHLVASIPGAREHRLPWAAHLPSLERPHEVTDLLVETLAEPDRRG